MFDQRHDDGEPDTQPADPPASGVRSVRTWVAFLIGAAGFLAGQRIGSGSPLVLVVILFIAGAAGALVESGSMQIRAPLLGSWAGLAGFLVVQFAAGHADETWPGLIVLFLVILAASVTAGASVVVVIRNLRQL